jgi:iron complex transport system substrate-binding protein
MHPFEKGGKGMKRIVSLTPSNTEIVHALGLIDQLVGVDDYSDFPRDALKTVRRLGPDLKIRIEDVKACEPDLVLASLSVPGMERVVEQVDHSGLRYEVLDPKSLADLWEDIRTVGRLTQTTDRAEQIVAELQQRVNRVRQQTSIRNDRPSLYWEWWPKPCISPGKRNWLTEISELAGARNLFADVDAESVIDAGHLVLERDPDYILAVWCGVEAARVPKNKILAREGWHRVKAIRSGRVFVLEEGLYCRPSPRLIDGLEQLAELLSSSSI